MAKIELSIPDEWLGTIVSRSIDLGIEVKDYFFLGALSLRHENEQELLAGIELLGFDSCLSFMLKRLKEGKIEDGYFNVMSRSNIAVQILGGSVDCRIWLADVFTGLENHLEEMGFNSIGTYKDIEDAFEMPLKQEDYAVFQTDNEVLGFVVSSGSRHEISDRIKQLFLVLYQVQHQDLTVVLSDPT
jgi:hypothetical protein